MFVIIKRIYSKPVFSSAFSVSLLSAPPPLFTSPILFLIPPPALLELAVCQKPRVVDAPPVERE